MNRKLRTMGIALVAAFALSAVSVASASAAEFHSESTTTYLSGNQVTENVFTTGAGNVKCKKAVFTGKTTAKTVTTLVITPAYSECTAFGQAATVTMNGCTYNFTASSATAGAVVIVCPAGKVIQVGVPGGACSLTIAGQTPTKNTVDYKNEGAGTGQQVLVTSTVGGIAHTVVGGGICGAAGNAVYHGSVLEKGFSNEALTTQTGIWVA